MAQKNYFQIYISREKNGFIEKM